MGKGYDFAVGDSESSLDTASSRVSYRQKNHTELGFNNSGYIGDDENSIQDKNEEETDAKQKPNMVGMLEMFRFADAKDKVLLITATITSILHGTAQPLMVVIFGYMSDTFIDDAIFSNWLDTIMPNITMFYPNVTKDMIMDDPSMIYPALEALNMSDLIQEIEDRVAVDLLEQMNTYAIYYCALGAAVFVLAYIHIACWQAAAYRQCQRIRSLLFQSILKQEIGWYDTHETGELSTRLADDVTQIQEGIGDKLGMFMQFFSTFLTGFIMGFVHGWKLTLVILSVTPLLGMASGLMSKLGAIFTSRELNAYAKAGAVAEEVISSIRTVVAFGGQNKEIDRYSSNLHDAKVMGIRRGMVTGLGMGTVFLMLFCSYSLAFWYGSSLVWDREYTGGTVLLVFMSVMIASFSLGNAAPNLQEFSQARGAAYMVYSIIDQQPKIDSSSTEGLKPEHMVGNVQFKGVKFSYPARPNITVLNGLDLSVNVGQTVALVGSSGCGKSTTVQLLQRFYDPLEGQVLIDGRDIREYNIKWLRQHIGVVSQEPVLFDTTISENIGYGKDGVSKKDIEMACRKANVHDFITKLPKGYNTLVGERGTQLSGGQKQRIAIARALVRDPKILLLDEATSALDTESEATVQGALDKAREGRTTIVIAHRLSTIKTADQIASFELGRIKELGSHDELMSKEGIYHTLVTNQSMQDEEGHLNEESKPRLQHQYSVASNDYKRQRTVSGGSYEKGQRALSFAEQEEELLEPSMGRVFRMNAPEYGFIIIGCVASFIAGAVQPTFAVMLSEIIGVYAELDQATQEEKVDLYAGMMAVIGVIAGLAMFTMNYMFGYSGEKLTERLRRITFYSLLKQEVGYFDDPRNSTGALCTRLSSDASAVKGATGIRLGTVVRSLSSIGVAIGIAFYFSWKLSLVILAFAPIIMLAGFIQMKLFSGQSRDSRANLEGAGKIAVQAIENMRTVATLTKEELFHQIYYDLTLAPIKKNMRQAHFLGLGYGISQGTIFFAYAASFSYGATLVQNNEVEFNDLYKVIMSVAMGAMAVGQANSFAPDYGKAKEAAARCFQLHDREPAINSFNEDGKKLSKVQSNIDVDSVEFFYPTRPNVQVLRGLSLHVESGQTVALVGSSGCGKSTIVQLLERFYDPVSGHLNLDGEDIADLNIQWLRGQMGIVSQEPILFDASIRENIAYGDNSRPIPMDEIIKAAKDANIHNFIQALPHGYDTNVGDKGTQLSGGQKQRVAIARALVRNPKILLLDEATSALDTESEKVVQEALDRAQEGRTSIVIAHRLSTIQNADKIVVIQNGQVAETGTHSQLLAKKGFYHKLNVVQMRNTQS